MTRKHAQLIMGTWPIYKNLLTTDLNKKTFHLIKHLLTTFIFFPFCSISTCSLNYLEHNNFVDKSDTYTEE